MKNLIFLPLRLNFVCCSGKKVPQNQIEYPERAWWKEQVVYEIYPRSFKDSDGDGIGDLRGIIAKLDYLDTLGVDIIWLGPHFDSPNTDNGYDIRDYRKVMKEFGTMADFDELLAGIKERGMKLIIDLVVNHTSDEHEWFKQSRSSKDNPFRDYYIWREGKNDKPPNNWPSFFGGSGWEKAGPDGEYYLHYFAKKQPDLNWENPKVRAEVYDIMRFWLDKGVDGFRMDVIPFISKNQNFPDMTEEQLLAPANYFVTGPRLHEFLKEMNTDVLSEYDAMTVGEAFGGGQDLIDKMTDERNKELNLAFGFDIAAMGFDFYKENEWTLPEWKALFARQNTPGIYHWPAKFLDNHDSHRSVSKFGSKNPAFREASAKLLAMLMLTQKGTPFLYQGNELGMTNHTFTYLDEFNDLAVSGLRDLWLERFGGDDDDYLRELNKTSRDHSRTVMQWSSDNFGGFTTGNSVWFMVNPNYTEINAQTQLADTNSVFHFYRNLLNFRRGNLDLIYGNYIDLAPHHEQIFAYTRTGKRSSYLVVLNMSDDQVTFSPGEEYEGSELVISNLQVDSNPTEWNPWESRLYNY